MAGRAFAEHFRACVIPDLRAAVIVHAMRVAFEESSYGEAYSAVTGEAMRRGASHLPIVLLDDRGEVVARPFDDLLGSIHTWLGDAIEQELAAREEAAPIADRVARQWRDHLRLLAEREAGLTDLDAWEWA